MEKEQTPVLQSMETVAEDILTGTDSKENFLSEGDMPERSPMEMMYVMSNKEKTYGAAVLSCPGVMEKVSRLFPEGFYILPSSVHEVLIVPKEQGISPKDLGQMVREVNRAEVAREEVLSDRVYEYDKEAQKIRQVPESIERARGMER